MVFFDTCGEERREGAASGEINDEQFEFCQILQSFSRREDFKTVSQAKKNLGEYVRDILKELLVFRYSLTSCQTVSVKKFTTRCQPKVLLSKS